MSKFYDNKAYKLLSDRYGEIKTLLGDAKANMFLSAYKQLTLDNNLVNVIPKSLASVAMSVVRLGLEIDPAYKEVSIVPYEIKKNDGTSFTIAQLVISSKGYKTLAARDGILIKSFVVYKNDKFEYKFTGWKEEFVYEPNFEDRENDNSTWVWGNLKLAFATAKLPNGEILQYFLGKNQIIKRKEINPKNNVWNKWTEEMITKTIIKHAAKALPRITEDSILKQAIEAEDVIYDNRKVAELVKDKKLLEQNSNQNEVKPLNNTNIPVENNQNLKTKNTQAIIPPKQNENDSFDLNSMFQKAKEEVIYQNTQDKELTYVIYIEEAGA